MVSKVLDIPLDDVNKYAPCDFRNLDFTILHPLGVQDAYGNYRILFLNNVEDNLLRFKHEVTEGTFLVLMKTTPDITVNSLYNEISKLKNFNKPS